MFVALRQETRAGAVQRTVWRDSGQTYEASEGNRARKAGGQLGLSKDTPRHDVLIVAACCAQARTLLRWRWGESFDEALGRRKLRPGVDEVRVDHRLHRVPLDQADGECSQRIGRYVGAVRFFRRE